MNKKTIFDLFEIDMNMLKKNHDVLVEFEKNISKALGNSVFIEPLWQMYEDLVHQIELKYEGDISDSWISWYSYENFWGTKKYTAGYDNKVSKIKNIKDLWKLIQKGKEQQIKEN